MTSTPSPAKRTAFGKSASSSRSSPSGEDEDWVGEPGPARVEAESSSRADHAEVHDVDLQATHRLLAEEVAGPAPAGLAMPQM